MINKNSFPLFRMSLLSATIAAVAAHSTAVMAADAADSEEIVVTGFKASLQSATDAKKKSVGFGESVFAEDIGKFSDLNIAESLNRIPGVQLKRDVNGEGVNVQIRGLNTNFTKITLNGSSVAIASSGTINSQNQNREVDLNLFPTELFTRFDVDKTPSAHQLEGGIAGTVNMRSARPFDVSGDGFHSNYQVQGSYGSQSKETAPRAALTTSWHNDTFGVLVGIAGQDSKYYSTGFESVGWTNLSINNGVCGRTPTGTETNASVNVACNTTGGNNWGLPGINSTTGLGAVPAGTGNGLVAGTVINKAFLLAQNPGLTLDQISNALIPRLGREVYAKGNTARTAGIASFEFRPSDSMHYYLDLMYARSDNDLDRIDLSLVGRNGLAIPMNMKVDANNVVTSVTLANAQYFLEARNWEDTTKFYSVNPGAHIEFNDTNQLDIQANSSQSHWDRANPTFGLLSPFVTVNYSNPEGAKFPSIFDAKYNDGTTFDVNNPNAGWTWGGAQNQFGRLNLSAERRITKNDGARADYRFGDDTNNLKFGVAYDRNYRFISGRGNDGRWEDVACRGGAKVAADGTVPTKAQGRLDCTGTNPGNLIPNSSIASYLKAGPEGFVTPDFKKFLPASGYYPLLASAPDTNGATSGASSGLVEEKTKGAYLELNEESEVAGRSLRTNMGMRYVDTNQVIAGPVTVSGVTSYQYLDTDYHAFLPSFNAVYSLTDDLKLRTAASRSMTRANPSQMLPATVFSDPSAQNASQGNPNLSPYFSNNLEFGGEWYTGGEGYIGVTSFAKQITGYPTSGTKVIGFNELGIPFDSLTPQQQGAINNAGGTAAAKVTVTTQVTSPSVLNLYGTELSWVQPLDMLVQGLGFTANYTNVSQSSSGGAGAPVTANGISPVTYNFTGYWQNFGAEIRLSYTWNDKQYGSDLNQNGIPLARTFTDARGQWDLSASYDLSGVLPTDPKITLNIMNITNSYQRSYFQYSNAAFEYYKPGFTAVLGVSGKF